MMASTPVKTRRSAFALWQVGTVSLIVLGYAGYYLCRSDLADAMPLLIAELAKHGISADLAKVEMGSVASLGVLAYALGKFPGGPFGGDGRLLSPSQEFQ